MEKWGANEVGTGGFRKLGEKTPVNSQRMYPIKLKLQIRFPQTFNYVHLFCIYLLRGTNLATRTPALQMLLRLNLGTWNDFTVKFTAE